jgi:hypothetical protein
VTLEEHKETAPGLAFVTLTALNEVRIGELAKHSVRDSDGPLLRIKVRFGS